jgi:probable rRNA maturation factor
VSPDGPRDRTSRSKRVGPDDGEPVVYAADEQGDVEVDLRSLTALAEHVLAEERVRGDCELSLHLVDESTVADLNARFLGRSGPTDVLAFPIDDDLVEVGRSPDSGTPGPDRQPVEPDDVPVLLGDIVVCPAVAARNAVEHNRTTDDELQLLVVHGALHVLGMDHADEAETVRMQAREQELLASFRATHVTPE